jgi:hypothetical protein
VHSIIGLTEYGPGQVLLHYHQRMNKPTLISDSNKVQQHHHVLFPPVAVIQYLWHRTKSLNRHFPKVQDVLRPRDLDIFLIDETDKRTGVQIQQIDLVLV